MSSLILGVPDGDQIKQYFEEHLLKENKLRISILPKHLKEGVYTAVQNNDSVEYVIIHYSLESTKPFTVNELSRIKAFNSAAKIIMILPGTLKGSPYITELYEKGFYLGLFEEDANISKISNLMVNGRSKEETEQYYSISIQKYASNIDLGRMKKNVLLLCNRSDTQLDFPTKVEHVHKMLTTEEFLYVLNNLPNDVLEDVAALESFKIYFHEDSPNTKSKGIFKRKKNAKALVKNRIKDISEIPEDILSTTPSPPIAPIKSDFSNTLDKQQNRKHKKVKEESYNPTPVQERRSVSGENKPVVKSAETRKTEFHDSNRIATSQLQTVFEKAISEVKQDKEQKEQKELSTVKPLQPHEEVTIGKPDSLNKINESNSSVGIGVRKPINLKPVVNPVPTQVNEQPMNVSANTEIPQPKAEDSNNTPIKRNEGVEAKNETLKVTIEEDKDLVKDTDRVKAETEKPQDSKKTKKEKGLEFWNKVLEDNLIDDLEPDMIITNDTDEQLVQEVMNQEELKQDVFEVVEEVDEKKSETILETSLETPIEAEDILPEHNATVEKELTEINLSEEREETINESIQEENISKEPFKANDGFQNLFIDNEVSVETSSESNEQSKIDDTETQCVSEKPTIEEEDIKEVAVEQKSNEELLTDIPTVTLSIEPEEISEEKENKEIEVSNEPSSVYQAENNEVEEPHSNPVNEELIEEEKQTNEHSEEKEKTKDVVVNSFSYTDNLYDFADENRVDIYEDNTDTPINAASLFSDHTDTNPKDVDNGNAYVKNKMNEVNNLLQDIDINIDTNFKDIELPDFNSSEFYKLSTGIKKGKKVIGVCGLSQRAGNTFISLNCAKAISEMGESIAIIEIPFLTRASLYDDLSLGSVLNNSFQSVFVKNESGRLHDINTYMGIDFMVIEPQRSLEDWQLADTLDILSRVNEAIVIDMGTDLASVNRSGLMNVLTDLVLVVDVNRIEEHIEELRVFKEKARQLKLTPSIVFNNSDVKQSESYYRFFDPSYNRLSISTRNHSIQNPFVLKKQEYRKLQELFHLEQNEEVPKTIVEPTSSITKIGSMEIGFMGVEYGVGTTHNAIMCASVLKSDFKVCILEINDTSHFRRLYEYIYNKEPSRSDCMFSSLGIDFYFNISYTEFSAKYRQKYDCIIIDFGEYPCGEMDDFIRCNKKFIVAHGVEWKRKELMKCYDVLTEQDTIGDWIYLIPFMEPSAIREIRKQCCPYNLVVGVPFLRNPYMVGEEIIQLYQKALGIPVRKKKKLFGR